MPAATPSDPTLHLPSLVIKNFRGIDELTIPRLGRVTLLAGKNGVGKSTVLDAVRVYATGGHRLTLADILRSNDEILLALDDDGREVTLANWDSLFGGRNNYPGQSMSIGSTDQANALQIQAVSLTEDDRAKLARSQFSSFADAEMLALAIKFQGSKRKLLPFDAAMTPSRARQGNRTAYPPDINCGVLGPDVPDNVTIESYLNSLALTPHEDDAVAALNLVVEPPVQRVAMVDSGTRRELRHGRRVLVKIAGEDRPAPLRSLGDGAVQIFAVALALASSSDGFLLIDEAENGLHHSIQAKFWKMVLQTAQRNNVQVLATTHSWDCVVGFAQAASELEEVEGMLVRLERVPVGLNAITYDKSRLAIAAYSNIEVR